MYDNNTIYDDFFYNIDLAVEERNANIIYKTIKKYENIIEKAYIDTAYKIYRELVMDQLEDMEL